MNVSPLSGAGRWRLPPTTPPAPAPPTGAAGAPSPQPRQFSVLNDFRYLSDSDKDLLGVVTGERIDPGITDRVGAASAFAQQLALDRRTGDLAPGQDVTAVYLRNASAEIDRANAGRPGFRNPYSGPFMDRAIAHLEATGRGRADIRM